MASTLHLAIATTLAVHLIAAVVVDAVGLVSKSKPKPPPPRLSLVDVDLAALRPPPPPPEPAPAPPPTDVVAPTPATPLPTSRRRVATAPITPPSETRPTPSTTPSTGGGDAPIYRLPDLGAGGGGPAIATGRPPTGPTGGGGSGGGTGGGSGSGAGPGVEAGPVSVAAIKTRAKPKGDFDYFDAGKDYPAEARALGVEGLIKAKLIVDERGRVVKATLVNRLGHGLDELALRRARALEFTPATDDRDRPVSSIVVWEFTFTLPS